MIARLYVAGLCLLAANAFAADAWFTDATDDYGLRFTHVNGFTPERRLVETMGSGGALFDYDGDGDLDLYLVQGNELPGIDPTTTDRLFEQRDGRFVDVTRETGLGSAAYGLGAVVGDFDREGAEDLYVTNLGANILYRNNGAGPFADATPPAGLRCALLSPRPAFAAYARAAPLAPYASDSVAHTLDTEAPCSFGGLPPS